MTSPCLLQQGRDLSSGFINFSSCNSRQQQEEGRRRRQFGLRIKSFLPLVCKQSRTSRDYGFPVLYSRQPALLPPQLSSPCGFLDRCKRNSGAAATRAITPRGSSSTVEKELKQNGFAVKKETALGKLAIRPSLREVVVFQEGKSPEHLRAAAYLRAMCFYTYPEGRSEEALKLHRKMKAEDECSALTSKVAGLEQGYKRVACIIALCPLSELADSSLSLNPSCKVVLANGEAHSVVGSLDLNQGLQLPGELSGDHPKDGEAEQKRGYLSNVCVAPQVHKRGIGAALLQRAQEVAQLWGVTDLYVHVVANNQAAMMLYTKGGFLYEKEETVSHARMLSRPRRLLLHKRIQTPIST
ncbi:unnamed protein product [Sphagnum jensenii]|uniref:N-acetyltransferase domain-containing protein n=1 Tax=Sphagnum jensenii TaxID=128206 RepID=A0ABP0XJU6_9BRYO